MKALVGRNGYLKRRLVGEVVRSAADKRLTESQLLEWFEVDPVVDSQETAADGRLIVREGERRISRGRGWRKRSKMGKANGGSRLKEDWKELGVDSVRRW